MTQRGKRTWFERMMVGFGMILAACFFVIADGDELCTFIGALLALSALLGFLRLAFRREPS